LGTRSIGALSPDGRSVGTRASRCTPVCLLMSVTTFFPSHRWTKLQPKRFSTGVALRRRPRTVSSLPRPFFSRGRALSVGPHPPNALAYPANKAVPSIAFLRIRPSRAVGASRHRTCSFWSLHSRWQPAKLAGGVPDFNRGRASSFRFRMWPMPMPRMGSCHESRGLQACYPATLHRSALQRAVLC
jgi:hypothetical protein